MSYWPHTQLYSSEIAVENKAAEILSYLWNINYIAKKRNTHNYQLFDANEKYNLLMKMEMGATIWKTIL